LPYTCIESLSPELRDLLQKEMAALQNGMMSKIPAYVSGSWNEIGFLVGAGLGALIWAISPILVGVVFLVGYGLLALLGAPVTSAKFY